MKKEKTMNDYLARSWWIWAVLSIAAFVVCPLVGWYGLVNVVVAGSALYVLYLARERKKRLLKIVGLNKKFNARQRKTLASLDRKAFGNIQSLSKMMPYFCFGVLMLDAYAYFYNLSNNRLMGIVPGMVLPAWASLLLLAIGLAAGVVFYFAWCQAMNEKLDLEG